MAERGGGGSFFAPPDLDADGFFALQFFRPGGGGGGAGLPVLGFGEMAPTGCPLGLKLTLRLGKRLALEFVFLTGGAVGNSRGLPVSTSSSVDAVPVLLSHKGCFLKQYNKNPA